MRFFPVAPLNARTANKDTVLPSGGGLDGSKPVLIRKNDILVFSSWSSHRLEASFGLDPEEFRPERWETLSADVAGFIPFNKGPRLCPGSEYLPIPQRRSALTISLTRTLCYDFHLLHGCSSTADLFTCNKLQSRTVG